MSLIDSCVSTVNSYDALVKVNKQRVMKIEKLEKIVSIQADRISIDSTRINTLKSDVSYWTGLYEDQKKVLRKKSISLWTSISSIPLVAILVGFLSSLFK